MHSYWRAQEYINADDAIAFCLYLIKKGGGKPLCNGHLFITAIFLCPAGGLIVKSFNYICIVPTVDSFKFFFIIIY